MAHAFYKDRLEHMLETLKVKAVGTFTEWAQRIDSSKEKSIEINMATEFSDILARNIIHICFGEDLSDDVLDFQVFDN